MNRRRDLLKGALALPLAAGAFLGASASCAGAALSANDARLVALADAYEALERWCVDYEAAHPTETEEEASEYEAVVNGFRLMEGEMIATPADTMVGVLAKARLCQVPSARTFAEEDCPLLAVVDDLHRLFGASALS